MATLADIRGIAHDVNVYREDTTPAGHFIAGINVNGTAVFYLLKGNEGSNGARVKGRIEIPLTAGCLTGNMSYFVGSTLAGGKAAGKVSSFEEAYTEIAEKE